MSTFARGLRPAAAEEVRFERAMEKCTDSPLTKSIQFRLLVRAEVRCRRTCASARRPVLLSLPLPTSIALPLRQRLPRDIPTPLLPSHSRPISCTRTSCCHLKRREHETPQYDREAEPRISDDIWVHVLRAERDEPPRSAVRTVYANKPIPSSQPSRSLRALSVRMVHLPTACLGCAHPSSVPPSNQPCHPDH